MYVKKRRSYGKFVRTMLMKLTARVNFTILASQSAMQRRSSHGNLCPTLPGVNFTSILLAAFALADPKSGKKTDNLTFLFALSGFAGVKAACRTLMKLIPGVNFINILLKTFLYESILCNFALVTVWILIFWCKSICKKVACKTLMKLTTVSTTTKRFTDLGKPNFLMVVWF